MAFGYCFKISVENRLSGHGRLYHLLRALRQGKTYWKRACKNNSPEKARSGHIGQNGKHAGHFSRRCFQRLILETLDPKLIVTDKAHFEFTKSLGFKGEILISEELAESEADEAILSKIADGACEDDPLYVIFTSGSSGKPKGVITSHRSLMCYIDAYRSVMNIDRNEVLGNQSPLDYIAAIRDIYLPVYTGASTYIIPTVYFTSPVKLFEALDREKITCIGWSVSALTLPTSMGAFNHITPRYLKKICFSGSVMPCKYLKIWQEKLPDALFVNQYGPTEATASCTYYIIKEKVKDDDILPIGIPYRNYKVFLLNDDNTATAKGQKGEICVSGPILSLGYYNDPERTAASFIQNPLNGVYRELIYKTGDLGRVREDGCLEFHGRKDRQFKHLGHRVEPEEIETAAGKAEGVSACAALYDGKKELIYLFYAGEASPKDISVYLRKILPGFMVPRKFVKSDRLPSLPNGKTDIESLKKYFE